MYGLSALELDARLVPLYKLMAEHADREAGLATKKSTAAARPGGGGGGGAAGAGPMSESEAERILKSHFSGR